MLSFPVIFSVDLSSQKLIYENEDFQFYSEDPKDYDQIIKTLSQKYVEFSDLFKKTLPGKIKVYIFSDQLSFSEKVFNSDVPVQNAAGLADYGQRRIFITSFYDTCKPRSVLLKMPVHELVHIFYKGQAIWIREGIAHYLSDMADPLDKENLSSRFDDFIFYAEGTAATKKAYDESAWMIKFILEELCHNDFAMLLEYLADYQNYKILGLQNENGLFEKWKEYIKLQKNKSGA